METQTHEEFLTLSQAARRSPGIVSPNAVWRWCRRGVASRSGGRVRLEHIRVGARLYTRESWLREFGARLAEADAAYFDAKEAVADAADDRKSDFGATTSTAASSAQRPPSARDIEAELDAEGL